MKKIIFLLIMIILLIVSGCKVQPRNLNVCGDGKCTLTEDCNNCVIDCACRTDEYCDETGVCRSAVCGDEICLENEKETCCEDCGCPENQVCNKVTQKCQEKIVVKKDVINNVVNKYLSDNKIEGKIIKIIDTYYKNQAIKQVTIDCESRKMPYPCLRILFIDEKGEIVEEMRTA